MNPVYDHIIAIIVVGAIFVWAVALMPNVNLVNLTSVEQQQDRNIALNVFNNMLLDTGYPNDWGSCTTYFDSSVVKRFGLASASESNLYKLDPDKVQRLNKNNPLGYLKYDEARTLLNLKDYEFCLRIIPPFNVTNENGTKIDDKHTPLIFADPPTNSVLRYTIKVTYLDGSPIPNALVEGYVFCSKNKDFDLRPVQNTTTNALGICSEQMTLTLQNPDYVVVVLKITVADVATILLTMGKDASVYVADINMVGDTIILTKAKDPSNEDVKINEVYVYTSNGTLFSLYNGTNQDHFNTGSGQHMLWSRTFNGLKYRDPVALIFDVEAVTDKRREVVIAGPYRDILSYDIFDYGGNIGNAKSAVKIQRNVAIAGLIYVAELWLWKGYS
ncbi:MAG: hypothetical protein ACP5IM_01775 [Candidatus Bathyarchaeia archaeon]